MLLLEQDPYQYYHQRIPGAINPADIAYAWERWCGDTPWSRAMRRLGELGCLIRWWGGMPQSTLVPLCFEILLPNGNWFPCESRLKDLRAAVKYLENERTKPRLCPHCRVTLPYPWRKVCKSCQEKELLK